MERKQIGFSIFNNYIKSGKIIAILQLVFIFFKLKLLVG